MQHILVIDDDKSVCSAIKTVLEHEGYSAVVAEDGRSGLDLIETNEFDMAIVDLLLPGMDGLETIRLIRERAPLMPVVAISGLLFHDGAAPAHDALGMAGKFGATSALHKPFRARELLHAVESCLGVAEPMLP